MRVDGVFSFEAARAYGVRAAVRGPARAKDHAASATAPTPSRSEHGVEKLVAGRVTSSVDFHDNARRSDASTGNVQGFGARQNIVGGGVQHAGILAMYTRAADRVEAAVGVALGAMSQSIDVMA